MASGRQVKCAAGVGGDGDRIGGEWVGCPCGLRGLTGELNVGVMAGAFGAVDDGG